jgi:hypothetical protein
MRTVLLEVIIEVTGGIIFTNVEFSFAETGVEYTVTQLDSAANTLRVLPNNLGEVGGNGIARIVLTCRDYLPVDSSKYDKFVLLTDFVSPRLDGLRDTISISSACSKVFCQTKSDIMSTHLRRASDLRKDQGNHESVGRHICWPKSEPLQPNPDHRTKVQRHVVHEHHCDP